MSQRSSSLPREERAHRERERNGEPDVAEVEERRVGEHVRVLQARRHPRAVGRRGLCGEGARDRDEEEREEDRNAAKTGTTQTMRSRAQPRLRRTAAAPKPVRISSHSSSDPSCPPQNAEIVYGVGQRLARRPRDVRRTRSRCGGAPRAAREQRRASRRTTATSAFWAESASRRRPRYAASAPATSAYSERPSVTRSAARPSSGTARPSGGVGALLRRVLRRALRDHRVWLRDERSTFRAGRRPRCGVLP